MFSTRRLGSAEPACPDGTFLAGYIMDGWEKWRVVCLGVLDVEDVEDVYLFAGMTMGLLALGLGMLLQHQKLRKIVAELTRVRADIATTREEVVRARANATTAERDE